MNLVDSSGWLEYFADGPNAEFFAEPIEDTASLVVSTINVYEVFKRMMQERSEAAALAAITVMQQGRIVGLGPALAIQAAKLSVKEHLAMADSMIFATAQTEKAILWTQDADFETKPGVRYRAKQKGPAQVGQPV
jgi:predicted nucleic acid-binding protein